MMWKLDRVFIPVVLRDQTIMKSPSLSAWAERKHILFNRKRKIEMGLLVFKGSMLWQKVHYGIFDLDFWLLLPPFFFKFQYILSVCHFETNHLWMCLSIFITSAALQQPTGKGPRLPEVYCVISRLGCFDLFSTVSPGCLSSQTSPLLSLQQPCLTHNDFSRHVAKRLFTVEV